MTANAPTSFRAKMIVHGASTFLIVLGLFSFAAWRLHWPTALRWVPGMPLISIDTALSLILAGGALAASLKNLAMLSRALSGSLAILSALYCITGLSRTWFSIHYYFPELTATLAQPWGFRISSAAAFVFLLYSAALLLFGHLTLGTRAARWVEGLATAIIAIGTSALGMSLTKGLSGLVSPSSIVIMAIPTACASVAMGVGVLMLLRLKFTGSGIGFRPVYCAMLGLLILFAAVDSGIAFSAEEAMQTRRDAEVNGTQAGLVNDIVRAVRRTETGQRGFLLTGQTEFLSDYEQGRGEIALGVQKLRTQMSDGKTAAFRESVDAKKQEIEKTIALTRGGAKDEALALVKTRRGLVLMDQIDAREKALIAELQGELALRVAANEKSLRTIQATIVISYVLAALLVGLGYSLLRKEIGRRAVVEEQLQQNARELELRVAERTTQLAAQTVVLRKEIELRARTEDVIRETERRVQLGLGFAQVVVWTWNVADETVNWSGPVKDVFGVEVNSYAALRQMIVPEDVEMVDRKVADSVRDGCEYAAEFRVVHPAGQVRWIAGRGGARLGDSGRVVQMSGVNFDITERKQSEQKLAASERRFRELAESMPQIVWTAKGNGELDYRNQWWYRVTGLPPGEASEAAWDVVLHPQDLAQWRTECSEAYRAGRACGMEFRIWDVERQEYRWHLARREPILDAQGRVVYWYGTCIDIQERKTKEIKLAESEAALRKRESQLAMLFDTGQMGDWSWDIEKQHTTAHRSVFALYGEPQQSGTVPVSWFAGRFHPDESEMIAGALAAVRERNEQLKVDHRIVRPDGTICWVASRGVALLDSNGKASMVHGLSIDITEQKNAELKIQESERQLREQADGMPLIVWRFDAAGEIDYCNARWQEYSGYTFEQTKALGWNSTVHPDDFANCVEESARGLSGELAFTLEFRAKRAADGSYRWLLTQWFPCHDSNEKVLRWFAASVDIDDQKTLNERLEAQVGNRTAELRRSLREKETLLKEVHHRVKNNLQVISSLLSMQAYALQDAKSSAALKESRQRVLSMALVHERLYGGKQLEEIDFAEYSRSLVSELFASVGGDQTGVVCRFRVSSVLLNIDQAIPCGLILNELVTNAFKYAYPKGQGGEILIELSEWETGMVRLAVSDQGVGLPEGFDWRNTKSMGLPIVEMLAKQLGGKLDVRPRPGAAFAVEFSRKAKDSNAVVKAAEDGQSSHRAVAS